MTHGPTWHPREERPRVGRAVLVLWMVVFVGGMGLVVPNPAPAQTRPSETPTLIERYQSARRHVLAQRFLQRGQVLPVLPPDALPTAVDSLTRRSSKEPEEDEEELRSFPLRSARAVHRLERSWFEEQYADTRWSFLGAGTYRTFFDTTWTRELRARLQAQFGDPTHALGDEDPSEVEGGQAQFEYWFVVNDSIPVRVTDASGPKDRGLIVASDRRYRDRLRALRDTLLAPVRQPERAPYVDYYYDELVERWYRTGFDGQTYFLERISRTEIVPGRRPRKESNTNSSSSLSNTDDETSL